MIERSLQAWRHRALVAAFCASRGVADRQLARLGTAMREIELLANLADEAHYGRLRVPLEELDN